MKKACFILISAVVLCGLVAVGILTVYKNSIQNGLSTRFAVRVDEPVFSEHDLDEEIKDTTLNYLLENSSLTQKDMDMILSAPDSYALAKVTCYINNDSSTDVTFNLVCAEVENLWIDDTFKITSTIDCNADSAEAYEFGIIYEKSIDVEDYLKDGSIKICGKTNGLIKISVSVRVSD